MDFLTSIANFLTPFVNGLPVLAHDGDPKDYDLQHPVGAFLLKLEGGVLSAILPFKSSAMHVAGDYLVKVEKALTGVIALDDKNVAFDLIGNKYIAFDPEKKIDIHAIEFKVKDPAETIALPKEEIKTGDSE